MHELSIASGLVEKLLQFAQENPDKKLVEVRLMVGELSHIEPEQLRFCYESVTVDTPIGGSTLTIENVPASVICPHCGYNGRPKYWENVVDLAPIVTLRCPECGKAADAGQGHECSIKSVKFLRKEVA